MPEYLILAEVTQGNIAEMYTTLKNMEKKKKKYTILLEFCYFLIIFPELELLGNVKADITADTPNIYWVSGNQDTT